MSYSMSLNTGQKQSMKQAQRLIMSPQMQQAISLLQMPVMEMSTMIDAELEQNPVLEYIESTGTKDVEHLADDLTGGAEPDQAIDKEVTIDDRDFDIMRRLDEDYRDHFAESGGYAMKRTVEEDKLKSFLESSVTTEVSRFEFLIDQSKEHFDTEQELAIAEAILGNLDDSGFLDGTVEEIALLGGFDVDAVQCVLEEVHDFDPPGIAARDLRESLLIQLTRKGRRSSLAYKVVEQHFEDMLHNRVPQMKKSLGCSAADVQQAIEQDVACLDLHPGKGYVRQVVQHIAADVTLTEENGELVVEVIDEGMPSLRLNQRYLRMLDDDQLPLETKEYIKNKITSGKWLLRNIHQRNDTIYRITESLAKRQKAFFMSPEGKLVPLTMKAVAEELELHESTIARAVANKYVDCGRGLLPLRSFFTNAYVDEEGKDISSTTVKDALAEIIAAEDKSKPLSDEALSKQLKEKGISCARRTVAKYRTQFGIGNASQRRDYA